MRRELERLRLEKETYKRELEEARMYAQRQRLNYEVNNLLKGYG